LRPPITPRAFSGGAGRYVGRWSSGVDPRLPDGEPADRSGRHGTGRDPLWHRACQLSWASGWDQGASRWWARLGPSSPRWPAVPVRDPLSWDRRSSDRTPGVCHVCPGAHWPPSGSTRRGPACTCGLSARNPATADAMGIHVARTRYLYTILGGMLIGLGGAHLSLAYTPGWTENLTGGRGWIAIALVIFATWDPWRAVVGAILFGGSERRPVPPAGCWHDDPGSLPGHAALPLHHPRTRVHHLVGDLPQARRGTGSPGPAPTCVRSGAEIQTPVLFLPKPANNAIIAPGVTTPL
jgi:hypothetical protein